MHNIDTLKDIILDELPSHMKYLINDLTSAIIQEKGKAADERALYIAKYFEKYSPKDASKEIRGMYDLRYLESNTCPDCGSILRRKMSDYCCTACSWRGDI